MDTKEISIEKKPYISFILESILECPILRDGEFIPYETVVSELETDTVDVSTRLGLDVNSRFTCGDYGQYAGLLVQVHPFIQI